MLAVVMYALTIFTFSFGSWWLTALLAIVAFVSLAAIFGYHNRPLQAKMCVVAMMLTLIWYVCLAASDGSQTATSEISVVYPAIALILLAIARKSILADEKLVRAADRLR